jgi:hypothetical protein
MPKEFKVSIEEADFTPYLTDSIVQMMIFDDDFLKRCVRTLDEKTFDNERKVIVGLCYRYYLRYKRAPQDFVVDLVQEYCRKNGSKKKLLDKYMLKLFDMDINENYVYDSFKKYSQTAIATAAITHSQGMINNGDFAGAQSHVINEFRRAYSLGKNTLVNELEVDDRLEDIEDDLVMKTMIDPYDKKLGGLYRPELHMIFADTNVGKTYMGIEFAKAALIQGKNVLFITLETPKKKLKRRLAASLMGRLLKSSDGMLSDSESHGSIKRTKFLNALYTQKKNFLRRRGGKIWFHDATHFGLAELHEVLDGLEVVEECVPDLVILDSPRDMSSETNYRDPLQEEKHTYNELFAITKERYLCMVVTEQAQRKAAEAVLVIGKHMGAAYDKLRIVDSCDTLTQTIDMYRKNKLFLFNCKNRGAEKNILIEITQGLQHGQFIMSATERKLETVFGGGKTDD